MPESPLKLVQLYQKSKSYQQIYTVTQKMFTFAGCKENAFDDILLRMCIPSQIPHYWFEPQERGIERYKEYQNVFEQPTIFHGLKRAGTKNMHRCCIVFFCQRDLLCLFLLPFPHMKGDSHRRHGSFYSYRQNRNWERFL